MLRQGNQIGRLVAAVAVTACAVLTVGASAGAVTGTYRVAIRSWQPLDEMQPGFDRGVSEVMVRKITIRDQGLDGVISRIIMEPDEPIRNRRTVQRIRAKGTDEVLDLETGQRAWGTITARIKFEQEADRVVMTGRYHVVGDRGFWNRAIEDGRFRGIKRK